MTLTLLEELPRESYRLTLVLMRFEGELAADVPEDVRIVSLDVGVAAGDLLIAVWGNAINPSTNIPTGFTAIPGFEGFATALHHAPHLML